MDEIPARNRFIKLRTVAKDTDHGFYYGKGWMVVNLDHIRTATESQAPGPNNSTISLLTCMLTDGMPVTAIGKLDDLLGVSDG
jgi:hypothetical protein